MTVMEDANIVAPVSSPATTRATTAPGLASVLGSGDHKVVGRIWIVAALIDLVLVGASAVWVALLRVDSERLAADAPGLFDQAFAFRSIGGVFLFLLPLTIGIATIVVPLQVGAPTIAFPRAAAAAAWTHLLGGGLLVGAFAIDGGPLGRDVDGVRLFVAALLLMVVGFVVAWICIGTTVIALRAPGMALTRVPLFAWSHLVAAGVWIVTLPVLAGVLLVSYIDVRYGGAAGILGGGASTLYGRVAWVFSQPTVYAFGIPVLGFVGSVVPVFSSTRHRQHRVAMGLIGAFAVLSAGAWAMPGFAADAAPWLYKAPWVAVSLAVVAPLLGLLGLWALTARQGQVRLASPLLFGGVAALMLLVGLLAGALQAIKPIKTVVTGDGTSLYGTTVSTSVASYVVLAAGIAALGGVVFWAPKIFGRQVHEGGARLVAAALLAGTVLWSFPDLVSGILGQPAGPATLAPDNLDAIKACNVASAVGGVVLALALVGFAGLLARMGRNPRPGDDPWTGHTLEWITSSPPPVGNFGSLPAISSEAPLYDAHHGSQEVDA